MAREMRRGRGPAEELVQGKKAVPISRIFSRRGKGKKKTRTCNEREGIPERGNKKKKKMKKNFPAQGWLLPGNSAWAAGDAGRERETAEQDNC